MLDVVGGEPGVSGRARGSRGCRRRSAPRPSPRRRSLPLVIHILAPLRTQSSPSRTARVLMFAGSRAAVRLGEAEAADRLAGGHAGAATAASAPREPYLLDRGHRQRALHGHEACGCRSRRPPVPGRPGRTRRRSAGAAVALQVHAEHAELAELLAPVRAGRCAVLEPVGDVRPDALGERSARTVPRTSRSSSVSRLSRSSSRGSRQVLRDSCGRRS